jgi:hypothetical protein
MPKVNVAANLERLLLDGKNMTLQFFLVLDFCSSFVEGSGLWVFVRGERVDAGVELQTEEIVCGVFCHGGIWDTGKVRKLCAPLYVQG